MTPERAKQVQFSRPYSAATIVLYAPKKANIKAPADLKGRAWPWRARSTQDTALTAIAPEGTDIRRFDDDAVGDAGAAVGPGRRDRLRDDGGRPDRQARRRAPYENKLVLREQSMAMAMRPNQADLLTTTPTTSWPKNTANGELSKLYQKWLTLPTARDAHACLRGVDFASSDQE